ncbi:hypothetical protein [Phenylobacterium ferrooxidans]|uniref:Uncharacterized protein n=1 Tax=Phenylobacterium ferrooxidans TaxID=2982689 RepID=A0ABW6CLE7_9CAUL
MNEHQRGHIPLGWPTWLAICVACMGVGWTLGFAVQRGFWSQETAAWVQAIGSVIAIGFAVWIPNRQRHVALQHAAEGLFAAAENLLAATYLIQACVELDLRALRTLSTPAVKLETAVAGLAGVTASGLVAPQWIADAYSLESYGRTICHAFLESSGVSDDLFVGMVSLGNEESQKRYERLSLAYGKTPKSPLEFASESRERLEELQSYAMSGQWGVRR